MRTEIVGREEELAALRGFLGEVLLEPALLTLEGEAGIGKTVLWRAGVEEARRRGFRVLVSRPAEAEEGFAHSGLADLFEPVREEVLPLLPGPRRRALEVALLLEEPTAADEVDPRALGLAVVDTFQALTVESPVLVAIDDVQWLDGASIGALAFALRRLTDTRVALLLAQRVVTPHLERSELEGAMGGAHVRRLEVGPLSVGALHRLLSERLPRPFARQTLLRIHEHSGGNPFFALELARVIEADLDPSHPLRVPETLEDLVRARIAGLPPATRETLGLVAAAGPVDDALLRRAGVALETLAPAFDAHVVAREDETIRFTHPLLSSSLYADLGAGRPRVHARLASIVDDPLVQARHLALSHQTPDAAVAALLDEAAGVAAARGASRIAAELAEQALRLTPADTHTERHGRTLAAARAEHAAGEWTRARAMLEDLLDEVEEGSLRAHALMVLAELESLHSSVALLETALREAPPDTPLEASVHCRLAWATRFTTGLEHADRALELASALDDGLLTAHARAIRQVLVWFRGNAEAPPDLGRWTADFPAAVGGDQLVQEAALAVVNTFAHAPVREEVRVFFEREYEAWCARDEPRGARALWALAWIELWAGRWELAAAYAQQAHEISIQYGLERPQDHLPIALVALHRGALDVAQAHSERALRLSEEQLALHPPQHQAILGLVARARGDRTEAVRWFRGAEQRAAAFQWHEPSVRWWTSDWLELLLEDGNLDEAEHVLDVWRADALRVDRPYVLAQATRCQGLVAAARADVDRAVLLLEQAVDEHAAVGDPFGRARALLALGIVRRRARQKRPAREAIESALAEFERMDATIWAAKARGELGRIGGRKREEGLTAAERRVADLVAQGRTNREIAAALFLAERTVASHLTHIYAKLGVHSRTELAHRLHAGDPV
ncbi:MAG TPA: LuxR C-terminal-related transcriptional regulator [Gaiellaceae bacterium]|nr:LuxR C-terminal-related transcriptional regulator [Gaiellaceae bacterium]